MKDELITFETAKLAKEKEFNIPFIGYGPNGNISSFHGNYPQIYQSIPYYYAPTQSLLQRWLREVHEIFVFVNYYGKEQFWIEILNSKGNTIYNKSQDKDYNSYEEALEEGLQEALKLIK